MDYFTCQHVVGIKNFYGRLYRKVAICACSEYQAFLPPSLQRPGEEAIAQRRFNRVKRLAIISTVTSVLVIYPEFGQSGFILVINTTLSPGR